MLRDFMKPCTKMTVDAAVHIARLLSGGSFSDPTPLLSIFGVQ
jgi:hypothetical protein